jgi:two-component system CheB/CheR fusion protein
VYRNGGAHVGQEVPLRLRSETTGEAEERYVDFVYQAITDGGGRTTGIFVEGHDVTARVRANRALRDSETRWRMLVEGIPQLVWRANVKGAWTWSSPQWNDYTGQTQQESSGEGWLAAVHPEDRAKVVQSWEAAAAADGAVAVDHRIRRAADGAWLWHHSRSLPVRDAAGAIVEWLGTSTDIHQLKGLQDRQTLLVGELQHRTRNLISVIRAIAQQTLTSAESLQDFNVAFGARLSALGKVQSLLAMPAGEAITIDALLRLELDSVGAFMTPDRIEMRGPPVALGRSIVQMLALAFHELATNARKHGALSTSNGHLALSWRIVPGDGGPLLTLDWVESGLDQGESRHSTTGFGRFLLEKALPHLGAQTRFELANDGARYSICIPLHRQESAG